ncbi:sugar ABC transporter permease [Actinomadura logoneensis]|uniref:Sugar ABC transporter permease n=1 Tax=Actinomadura logoneensis TaxID=2293572 RepID=A0A372JE29_9ACTN|nr:sugar ABC transporter permease [Actinomadura logoneensis]RFU38104.1 sugar ABC transporter permease [Actinomadura logoneensis]
MTTLTAPTAAAGAGPRARRRARLRVLAFLSPWLVGVGLFFGYPLAATVYFSFTRYDLFTLRYVGFANYRFLLHDGDAWNAMKNTMWLVVLMVPLRMLFGLGIAQLLTHIRRGGSVLRSVFYLPYLIPPVSATVAFVFVTNPGTGPFPALTRHLGISLPDFFNDPSWSRPGLTLLGLWAVGDLMILLLAALLDVPRSLYEAAVLDGANAWQRFRYITLPSISPVLAFCAVTGVIQTLQYFTQALVAAKVASGQADTAGTQFAPGYPDGSTLTFPQWLYDEGFRQSNMGYACVLALVMFAVGMLFTLVLLRRFRAFAGEEAR